VTTGPAIEIVVFRLTADADEVAFQQASAAVAPAIAALDGFISRQLYRAPDGRWIDTVHWRHLDDALAAARRFPTLPGADAFSAVIDPASVTVLHGESVSDHVTAGG
jgi:hypothetical protein